MKNIRNGNNGLKKKLKEELRVFGGKPKK